ERIGIRRVFDQLQRDHVAERSILRQIHVCHSAAPQLLADFVLAEFAAGGRDHLGLRARMARPALGNVCPCPASRKKFCFRTASMSTSPGSSTAFLSNTFPKSEGRAPSRAATPAPLLF